MKNKKTDLYTQILHFRTHTHTYTYTLNKMSFNNDHKHTYISREEHSFRSEKLHTDTRIHTKEGQGIRLDM